MEARAYLAEEGRVLVEFDPVRSKEDRERAYAMSRRVTAGRWQGRYARAHYPLSVDKCNEMREVWGGQLLVHKDLGAWYRTAAVERQEQVARTSMTDAVLPWLQANAPDFYAWLKPDQRVAASWIVNAYRNGGLLADEVGVGKTPSVIAGLMERQVKGNILILCPKLSVRKVWGDMLRKWCPWPVYLCRGTRAQRQKVLDAYLEDPAETCVLVIVAEMLRVKAKRERGRLTDLEGYEYEDLFDIDWDVVVVDESHKLLGSMDIVKGNLAAEGLRRLNYAPSPLRIAATATPWGKGGRTESLFGTLHWLWPDELTSRWAWLPKYFQVEDKKVFVRGGGGATKTVKKVGGLLPGVEEQQLYKDLGPRVLRRTMEEVSPEHAGMKNWHEVLCEMDGPQAKQYETFALHGEVPIKGGILSSLGTLSFYTRARQCANGMLEMRDGKVRYTGHSNKIEELVAHLDQQGILDGSSRRKVVVASQFNEFLDVVAARLEGEGCPYLMLTGATSDSKRDKAMEDFQSLGGPQVFLLNGKAGGVSITLDAADEMHQLDEMYPPEANTQLHGRIFRRGRVHEVFYYFYRSAGTIDEQIGFNVEKGTAEQLRILDGRRGQEFARELARYRPPAS
jgi:SNF2 family DNA or RNA helicase